MKSLGFCEYLVDNQFANSNSYIFSPSTPTDIRFFSDCENYPYIMKSDWQYDSSVLCYSNYTNQLRGRLLNTVRIKEVLDTSPAPLLFAIRQKWYMIGKGFMAHCPSANFHEGMKLLFVACSSKHKTISDVSEVRFFFSRDMYKEDYKAVFPALKEIMLAHTGDVILTSNIEDRIGDKIVFPPGGTLSDRQNYKRAVMIECLRDFFT